MNNSDYSYYLMGCINDDCGWEGLDNETVGNSRCPKCGEICDIVDLDGPFYKEYGGRWNDK